MKLQASIHSQREQQPDNIIIRPAAFEAADGKTRAKKAVIRPATLLVAGLFVVLATIGWFLFTAKSVVINTQPTGANIDVSGITFKIGDHYLMRQGQYPMVVTAEGYYPLQQPLAVGTAQNQVKVLQLQKLPGHLRVDTSPVDNATVWIDGQQRGSAGELISDIAAGEHQLTVRAPRYLNTTQPLMIDGMDKRQTLTVTLTPGWANITVTSEPQGAQLLNGDEVLGQTPLTTELMQGRHRLTVRLPGYKEWQQQLEVSAGDTQTLDKIVLEKADGRIAVASTPEGASITVNGQYLGNTPKTLTLAPGEDYRLTLFKEGFHSASRGFDIHSGDNRQLAVKLAPELGAIRITSDHQDALLYLDGRLMGRANQTLSLPARHFQLKITKQGYVDHITNVLPRPQLEQVVDVRLTTVEEAKWARIKPVLALANGVTLKLFRPDVTFSMGASRREQGRRANENLYQVRLQRPFYLGIKEITNAQYRDFKKLHSSSHVKGNSLDGDSFPVVNLSWQQAALFCNWLSARENLPPFYRSQGGKIVGFDQSANGYRLPTEAEWGWAARYENGKMAKYAWGKQLPPIPGSGNFADRSGASLLGNIQAQYNDNFAVTAPVASFEPNSKGLFDLAGNVAEWIHDVYEIKSSRSQQPQIDPLGADEGEFHVIRGSSWRHGTMTDLRLAFRDYGNEPRNDVGFRVARFVE